jgi:hypothetical protein
MGLVLVHDQLLVDDVALLFQLDRVEDGVQEHVRQHIPKVLEAVGAGFAVKAGVLLGGEGVEIPPNPLDILRDAERGAFLGALEEHVLNEVGSSTEGIGLVPSPHFDPNAQADTAHVGQRGGGDGQPVLSCGGFDFKHGSDGGRNWRLGKCAPSFAATPRARPEWSGWLARQAELIPMSRDQLSFVPLGKQVRVPNRVVQPKNRPDGRPGFPVSHMTSSCCASARCIPGWW